MSKIQLTDEVLEQATHLIKSLNALNIPREAISEIQSGLCSTQESETEDGSVGTLLNTLRVGYTPVTNMEPVWNSEDDKVRLYIAEKKGEYYDALAVEWNSVEADATDIWDIHSVKVEVLFSLKGYHSDGARHLEIARDKDGAIPGYLYYPRLKDLATMFNILDNIGRDIKHDPTRYTCLKTVIVGDVTTMSAVFMLGRNAELLCPSNFGWSKVHMPNSDNVMGRTIGRIFNDLKIADTLGRDALMVANNKLDTCVFFVDSAGDIFVRDKDGQVVVPMQDDSTDLSIFTPDELKWIEDNAESLIGV